MTTNTRLGELEARVQECRVLCRFGSASEDCLIADLAAALLALYGMSGSVTDLEECIALYEEALDLRPVGHPRRAVTLGNLGLALWSFCTYHAQDETRLQRCVTSHREALALRPLGHDDHAISMSNLANALDTTHDQHGGHDLLREVIYLRREVLRVCPPGALNHDGALHNLGLTLHDSFSAYGGLERLAESVALLRQALEFRPPGHPSRHSSLNSLANALRANFEAQGDMRHLLEAVSLHREALQLYPSGHPHHIISVTNLANSLQIIYKHGRVVSVLEEAITLRREALRSCPPGHPSRSSALVNLAVTLHIRSEAQETSDTLTEALFLYRELLQICPPRHPGRHNALNSYATSLQAKFERHHDKADLEKALAQYREALEVCPVGHPDRAWIHSSVGRCLLYSNTPFFDFARGVEHMSQGLSENSATARDRFQHALVDLRRVESAYHSVMNELEESAEAVRSMDLLALYQQAIRLLPRVVNFGLADHTARLEATAGSDEISRNAAARALNLGRTSEAVEMLEEGRGVFWSQALRLRASGLDGVPDKDRRELEHLFHALQYGGGSSRMGDATAAGRERQLEERRLLNEQAEHLIAQLRTRPGLERFLMPPAFDRLIQSLPEGFVVVLISSALGYHALILNGGAGTAINLKLQPPHGGFLSPRVKSTLPRGLPAVESEKKDADVLMESRGVFVSRRQHPGLESTLNDLWSSIVKPMINTLALKKDTLRHRPRMWWCVTGDLAVLPIHAAGKYSEPEQQCASDYVLSSYIPSLSALTKARKDWKPIARENISGLLVSESSPGRGYVPILNVDAETRAVLDSCAGTGARFVSGADEAWTVSAIISALEKGDVNILHMACHGVQSPRPLESSFVLKDGNLAIQDLMRLDLRRAAFAFLSACQTAQGDQSHPDQAVHLAASMLFCGFRSVIGTMWSMNDEDGPGVAQGVYGRLLGNEQLDLDEVPYALDAAVRELREAGVPASRWALFVHLGG